MNITYIKTAVRYRRRIAASLTPVCTRVPLETTPKIKHKQDKEEPSAICIPLIFIAFLCASLFIILRFRDHVAEAGCHCEFTDAPGKHAATMNHSFTLLLFLTPLLLDLTHRDVSSALYTPIVQS